MPIIQRYVIEQKRQVIVEANSASDALLVGKATLEGTKQPEGVWGRPISDIRELQLITTKQRD